MAKIIFLLGTFVLLYKYLLVSGGKQDYFNPIISCFKK